MSGLFTSVRQLFKERFNLDEDKAEESEIVASIRKNVEFKGANLWTLIFAIFIASIGLNVNSTAVIIGAMLISPLMGPIMGIGLGIGINDLQLVRYGIKNLFIAAFFSIITSTFYFWITPLHEAQSEILARTTPTVWDVFIAFFGGLAGIVAGTRKEKTNVIPGVAIATALMPPLCTAGFGLANGYFYYFLGALYLFFINSVFICIGTFLIVRFLKFHKKEFVDKGIEKRVSRTILWLVIITILPSIYLAYNLVDKSIFETNAKKFVNAEFQFAKTQVINETYVWERGKKKINLLLIGEEIPEDELDTIKGRMRNYKLNKTDLIVQQGLNAKNEIDFSAIKASIVKDVFRRADSTLNYQQQYPKETDIKDEIKALYPDIVAYSITEVVYHRIDTIQKDTVTLALFNFKSRQTLSERLKLREWLKIRLKVDTVQLVIE